jgi:hypothetical protein
LLEVFLNVVVDVFIYEQNRRHNFKKKKKREKRERKEEDAHEMADEYVRSALHVSHGSKPITMTPRIERVLKLCKERLPMSRIHWSVYAWVVGAPAPGPWTYGDIQPVP